MSRRNGFTLTELLVVTAVSVVLVGMALPLVKFGMEEGRIRETSRQVNSFLARAKSHAAATGRSAGVWLERDASGLDRVTNLYLAEVPPPFSGAQSDSRVKVSGSGTGRTLAFVTGDTSNNDDTTTGLLETILKPDSQFGIQIDYKGPIYFGKAEGTSPRVYRLLSPLDGPPVQSTRGYSYQLYLPPQRVGSQHLELPRATFIDLENSGTGSVGKELASGAAGANRVVIVFSAAGSMSAIYLADETVAPMIPSSALHLLVARVRNDTLGYTSLNDPTSLWVSVGTNSGTVHTSDNGIAGGSGTVADAREFAIKHDVRGGR